MDPITSFLLVAGLTTLLSAAVTLVIRKPLGQILVEVCGNVERGRFWQVFSYVFIVLTALSGTLLFPPETQVATGETTPNFLAFVASFRAGVFGLLLSLASIAFVLMRAIRLQNGGAPVSGPTGTASAPRW